MRGIMLPHRRGTPLLLALLACAALAPKPAPAAEDPHARYAPPAPRSSQVMTPAASARLVSEGKSALWVYFVDKGETDARAFANEVRRAGDRVGDRARARRVREWGGRFIPDYYDVPVPALYVEGVRSTGAEVRHVSRWLNAVSVMADPATASRIASLPYVQSITAVGRAKRNEPVGPIAPLPAGAAPSAPFDRGLLESAPSREGARVAVSLGPPAGYGSSLIQLNGINAKAAQDSGYTAAGVVVAMLDTGFNKGHDATVQLKRIAEFDFVFGDSETANQAADATDQWDHGTGTWSVLGGYAPNQLIGPAYNASFLLAKTEYVPTETPVEEDNWLAAVEWADSLGADVISSSLAYFTFDNPAFSHTYAQMDGKTTVVSKAAALAARRGIVVANAMANSGPAVGSLQAPADADSILSVGAVDASDAIASFSSRGPTSDGRGKPEVVAQGVFTTWAVASTTNGYAGVSGTSLATPLIGGAAAQIREAHPEWTVQQIRYALKFSADKASTPDSTTYGWGRPNVVTAIYGTPLGGPVYPKPFSLLIPANAATVTFPPYIFRWQRSPDPNGDPVTYRLQIRHAVSDSLIFDASTTDTSMTFPGYLGPSTTYRWYVSASDPGSHARESRDRYTFVTGATTSVDITPPAMGVVLYPNRPNPVQSSTLIPFAIGANSPAGVAQVSLRIFDASGRLVRTLLDGDVEAIPTVRLPRWDGRDEKGHRVGSGIYYYRLAVSGRVLSRRMVVLR
jgi:subtilisin family serine protease